MERTRVTVVGGGFGGLFVASELLARGVDDLVVLDGNPAPGGVARTICRDGYELEPGVGTVMLPHPHLTPVLDHAGVALTPAIDAGTRYVYTRGRLVAVPSSPRALLAPLVPWPAKLRAAGEPFIRTPPRSADESIAEFLARRLGDGMGATLAWLAASGVFAGDPRRLSMASSFPAFPALEQLGGSIVGGGVKRFRRRAPGARRPTSHVPPKGGMAAIAEAIATRLGDSYRPDSPVESVRPAGDGWEVRGPVNHHADHVVLATSPPVAAGLLEGTLADRLDRAVSAPVVVVGIGADRSGFELPPGFGVLTGPAAGTATLGILFESSYAPHRAPTGKALVKAIVGGATRREVIEWDDDRVVATVREDLRQILGLEVSPSFVEIIRHPRGIPQYEVGHGAWLAEVAMATPPGLHLTGWGYRGVGVAHLATNAVRLAESITT